MHICTTACMSRPELLCCNDASCDVNLSTMAELLRTKSCIINTMALTNKVGFVEDKSVCQ